MSLRQVLIGVALGAAFGVLGLVGCGSASGPHAANATAVAPTSASTRGASPAAGTKSTGAGASGAGAHSNVTGTSSKPSASTGVPYEINNTSMEPTYRLGTKVYYDPAWTHPQIGDVIVFYLPVGGTEGSCGTVMEGRKACAVAKPGLTKDLVMKRVVGLPGDRIAIREGRVIRNGRPGQEPPTIPCGTELGCNFPEAITVPADSYYVMVDNRALYHQDSRLWGAVPQTAIVGTVENG